MIAKKSETIFVTPDRKQCPVCGKVAYSLGGVHPQCAIVQSDAVVRARMRKRSQRK